jgi:hypothetical protein
MNGWFPVLKQKPEEEESLEMRKEGYAGGCKD